MNARELEVWLLDQYPGMRILNTYGEISCFYNPDGVLPKGIYFATIKLEDGPNDKASNLNRPGVYRLSFGLGRPNYTLLFGAPPKRPLKGKTVDLELDFEQTDQLMPHPIYSWMSWACVLSPSKQTIDDLKYLLDAAYAKNLEAYRRKLRQLDQQ